MKPTDESGNRWTESQQAMVDETIGHARRLSRIPFLWQRAQRVRKGCTPCEVVYQEGHVRLLHYTNGRPQYAPPLVFIFALVNRPYILDLKPDRSVIRHFVERGFSTYLIDWGVPTAADRYLRFEDYINGYLRNILDYLCERHGTSSVNILGYCMGGTMSSMFAALYPKRVRNLILMAAGIDFASRNGLLNTWTEEKYFDVDKFIDVFGNCPAEFLQSAFQMLKPVQNLIEKPIQFFERLEDDDYVDNYFAMEGWLNDNIPVPGEVFRQFVKDLFQNNLLTQNQFRIGRRLVNLRNIVCPVLNLMAKHDDLVPCSQSAPFNDLVGSKDRQAINFPAGHIGLAVGSKAQRELWPKVCDWLAERSDAIHTRHKNAKSD